MKLTQHFSLAELTASQTADRKGIDNTPPPEVIQRLTKLAHGLEMVRALVQCPLIISSGYRSLMVNGLVGSKSTSQHVRGEAADFTAPAFGTPAALMDAIHRKRETIRYDQCILEYAAKGGGWVHISFSDTPRMQSLVIDGTGTRVFA